VTMSVGCIRYTRKIIKKERERDANREGETD